MRRNLQFLIAIPLLAGILLFARCGKNVDHAAQATNNTTQTPSNNESKTAPQSVTVPTEIKMTVPAGQEIHVRLVDSIGSARNRSGDTFAASLDEPIEADGEVVVPRGANVTGRVIAARPSGHLRTPAELAVTLTSIEVDGRPYEMATSNRSWAQRSHRKRNAEWIGGAAGAGAMIGALIGHGKGAAIGAGIGAGGGTATACATGKKDVLPSETRLSFVLRHPLTITKTG